MESRLPADVDSAAVRRLVLAGRAAIAQLSPILVAEGFSFDEWLVLDALASADGMTMSELAALTFVTSPSLTRYVDALVSRALVYREVGSVDRRQVRVYLSKRGKSVAKRLGAIVSQAG